MKIVINHACFEKKVTSNKAALTGFWLAISVLE